ncbi:hypothetical protein EW145_g2321 [Phellinidium pouzarii]|uniref:Ribosome biogenesis protein NOP53 n=1 Tax=Phellinidium pouzarii TaxID=167371 RepID=A0A4S4LCW3_9AGAM|nr:hypothetical protein EW145_g2321 [Phellinidium pouzarii]
MAKTLTEKLSRNNTGSPAQYAQPSRKGKKAWRKNVDIGEVEEGLEGMRAEERETGSTLQSKTNSELYHIDVKGDDGVRKHLPKFDRTQLSYNKVLAERSAVTAVFSHKTRLLRIGKWKRLGPLNSIVDPTELNQGSAILEPSHAVKESGTYDVWMAAASDDEDAVSAEKKDFLLPLVEKPAVKVPQVDNPRAAIAIPAVVAPHAGASYNPPAAAHQQLLRLANDKAEKEEKMLNRYAAVKDKMAAARKVQAEVTLGVPTGMVVDSRDEPEGAEEEENGGAPVPSKPSSRKTKQQRRKEQKQLVERRALAERAAKKRFLSSLNTLKAVRKAVDKSLSTREQARLQKRLVLQEKLRKSGMAGHRLGKHFVQEGEPVVQLGDDLTESLRGLKVEGNLFKDRFLSLQHRALIEPRVPVLPKKHRPKTKSVEKFAWKNFD